MVNKNPVTISMSHYLNFYFLESLHYTHCTITINYPLSMNFLYGTVKGHTAICTNFYVILCT